MSPLSDAMSALYFVSGVDHVMFHHTGISHGQMRKWWLCYSRAYGLVVIVMDHDYSLASIEVPVNVSVHIRIHADCVTNGGIKPG